MVDEKWCDVQGNPISAARNRRTLFREGNKGGDIESSQHPADENRLRKSIPGIMMRLGLITVAIVYAIGSQFSILRRLHATDSATNVAEKPDTSHYYQPLPVSAQRTYEPPEHGNSMLRRIREETKRSMTSTTTTATATRTRTKGLVANRQHNAKISWPVLQHGNRFLPTIPPQKNGEASLYASNDQESDEGESTMDLPTSKRYLPTVPPRKDNNPESDEGEASTEISNSNDPESDDEMTASTAVTRTRIVGTEANSRNANKILWPVLQSSGTVETTTAGSKNSTTRTNFWIVPGNQKLGAALTPSAEPENPPSDPSVGDFKIIGFSDYNFRDVALKWYQRLADLGYTDHVLVAYDNAMVDFLQSLNDERAYYYNLDRQKMLPTKAQVEEAIASQNSAFHRDPPHGRNDTTPSAIDQKNLRYFYRFEKHILPPLPKKVLRWRRQRRHRKAREMMFAWRWHYILGQLEKGVSILLSDVDAIFTKHVDVAKDADFASFDVMHAYEGRSPTHVFEELGFTVNGGMNWLRSTRSTIAFVRKLVEICGTMCDDQIVLNEMIASDEILGIEWDDEASNDDEHNNTEEEEEEEEEGREPPPPRLPSKARTGRSSVTGHTVKIWEREWVFRGNPENPLECPGDSGDGTLGNNWISMPFAKSDLLGDDVKLTRGRSGAFKVALFDFWDSHCGINRTAANTRTQSTSPIR